MKLWDKGTTGSTEVHAFTVGNDRETDRRLAPFDVSATRAHCRMLTQTGLLTEAELAELTIGLDCLSEEVKQPTFTIPEAFEDIHSYLEFKLTEWHGDTGKKVHTARSRNDQVLTALQLYLKHELAVLRGKISAFGLLLCDKAALHQTDYIPGYTHTQVAMPSSIAMWLSAYAECLADDLLLVETCIQLADQNPLGTAAGYGSTFGIDRVFTTEAMGFGSLKVNPVAAQLNRGKLEQSVAFALSQVGMTVGKLANDCTWMLCQNTSFIAFPETITTGSSIMPHKKNPDVFELVRAKANQLSAIPVEIGAITRNLISGYHRDFQLLKEPVFKAIDTTRAIIDIMVFIMPQLVVKKIDFTEERYSGIFSVDQVANLVQKGASFRTAYGIVGKQLSSDEQTKPSPTTHIGSLDEPGIDLIRAKLRVAN
ncbi:MAG: hypothetical protein A3D31_14105 [Candidatus Fluviicola riflensis]|nr:MAG: hypothetical protein CHH17_18540 [Candidatus Fluviicola riflensis]OGS78109.1 MAG: hypothetical protein A3D31_14105 [Candidatus Fluviicola riflensis]OGS85175.1 MAG: hypothetical protein A2724_11040 [Fluviicola sp. RIFCSPHIGHO2_01_FULL_43_53]OGS89446.1 MAG: hypothetical protein A3E30_05345 [Fluviicola sp. RIFCSPHIGHO2_12_FULL_43_24]